MGRKEDEILSKPPEHIFLTKCYQYVVMYNGVPMATLSPDTSAELAALYLSNYNQLLLDALRKQLGDKLTDEQINARAIATLREVECVPTAEREFGGGPDIPQIIVPPTKKVRKA